MALDIGHLCFLVLLAWEKLRQPKLCVRYVHIDSVCQVSTFRLCILFKIPFFQELGFTYIELNASDARSKKILESTVADCLKNHSISDLFCSYYSFLLKSILFVSFMSYAISLLRFIIAIEKHSGTSGQRHCLLMDEVDGIAGNADRGGMAVSLIDCNHFKINLIMISNNFTV